jgi:hypothetical protein
MAGFLWTNTHSTRTRADDSGTDADDRLRRHMGRHHGSPADRHQGRRDDRRERYRLGGVPESGRGADAREGAGEGHDPEPVGWVVKARGSPLDQ